MAVRHAPAGDIGRRLALRREELGLTVEQAAERAGIAPGYLRYVEEQPSAVPDLGFLLRMAQALDTTVPKLRGSGAGLPPSLGGAAEHPVVTELAGDACMRLIGGHGVGRIALGTPDGPVILPVNYDVVDDSVVFRTEPGSIPSQAAGREVAFEVDSVDEALSQGWSVLLVGHAIPVTDAGRIRELDAAAYTAPWAGGERTTWQWMRIRPRRVSGRMISAAA